MPLLFHKVVLHVLSLPIVNMIKSTSYFCLVALFIAAIILSSCNKDVRTFSDMHFSFVFDETQERLDNFGNPATIPVGHAAQTPEFSLMSVHYIELSQDAFTPFKDGTILYMAPETDAGGESAINFDSSLLANENTDFLKVNLERLQPGTYLYARVSVAYQQYTVDYNLNNVPVIGNLPNQRGTVASFIGYRTYIGDLKIENLTTTINANKAQGFWGFETLFTDGLADYNAIYTGQAPAGATTVVNPIDATSPVPAGSCVITGAFTEPLVINGDETGELYISLSFSNNQSFEWVDTNGNGQWDIDATNPENTEAVTDMGLRGMIPSWEWK